jgi:hypothetical protein
MKTVSVALGALLFSGVAQASCPNLAGSYPRCTTEYEGNTSPSGGVEISQSVTPEGVTQYFRVITQEGGGSIERMDVADEQPRTEVSMDPDYPLKSTWITTSTCSDDGQALTIVDDYKVVNVTVPDDKPAGYLATYVHTKDASGRLHVSKTMVFTQGETMVMKIVCSP